MKLYYFKTPNSRKPCAVAKYLGSPVEYVEVDLKKGEHKTPEYLAVNPNGKAPSFEDGEMKLWEGHAIMAYLAQQASSDLWPSDPNTQIHVLKWLNWDTAHFSRWGGTLLFENGIKKAVGAGEPDSEVIVEAEGFYNQYATVLNDHLKGRKFIVDDKLSIADFGVAAVIPSAETAQLPLAGFDEIHRWHDQLMEIDAWREPWPA